MLSLVGASRGRPKGLRATLDSVMATARFPLEILIRLDDDDPTLPEYRQLCSGYNIIVGPRLGKGTARPTNAMARQALGNVIMHLSDDQEYITPDWNALICEVAFKYNNLPTAFKVDEGRSKLEHPIVNRAWIQRIGYLYPEDLQHLYCDTFIESVAAKAGRLVEIPTVKILHHKFKYGDATSQEARLNAQTDFQNFVKHQELINDLALKIAQ